MTTNEDIMAELRRMRQEQENHFRVLLTLSITEVLAPVLTDAEITYKVNAVVDEMRVP